MTEPVPAVNLSPEDRERYAGQWVAFETGTNPIRVVKVHDDLGELLRELGPNNGLGVMYVERPGERSPFDKLMKTHRHTQRHELRKFYPDPGVIYTHDNGEEYQVGLLFATQKRAEDLPLPELELLIDYCKGLIQRRVDNVADQIDGLDGESSD